MQITTIHYNKVFEKQFHVLPQKIKQKAVKAEKIFRDNVLHPSLRLHKLEGKLKGLWSISLDMKYRIVFKVLEDGVVLFISIGLHSIYEKLE